MYESFFIFKNILKNRRKLNENFVVGAWNSFDDFELHKNWKKVKFPLIYAFVFLKTTSPSTFNSYPQWSTSFFLPHSTIYNSSLNFLLFPANDFSFTSTNPRLLSKRSSSHKTFSTFHSTLHNPHSLSSKKSIFHEMILSLSGILLILSVTVNSFFAPQFFPFTKTGFHIERKKKKKVDFAGCFVYVGRKWEAKHKWKSFKVKIKYFCIMQGFGTERKVD